jgi:hypothetical protein
LAARTAGSSPTRSQAQLACPAITAITAVAANTANTAASAAPIRTSISTLAPSARRIKKSGGWRLAFPTR